MLLTAAATKINDYTQFFFLFGFKYFCFTVVGITDFKNVKNMIIHNRKLNIYAFCCCYRVTVITLVNQKVDLGRWANRPTMMFVTWRRFTRYHHKIS